MEKTKEQLAAELSRATSRLEELQATMATVAHNEGVLIRILDTGLAILRQRSLTDLMKFLAQDLGEMYRADRLAVRLLDPDGEISFLLQTCTSSPSPSAILISDATALGYNWSQRQGMPLQGLPPHVDGIGLNSDVSRAIALEPFSATRHAQLFPNSEVILRSVAVVPLESGNELLGMLALGSADAERYNSTLATDFLRLLSSLIIVALENQLNTARLEVVGLVDPLTGLFNRRYLDARLREEIQRARDQGTALSCMIIDADYFKRINDTFGHHGGDCVLKTIASRIRAHLKSRDIVTRFGGEEFVVISGEISELDSKLLADRIRTAVETQPVAIDGQGDVSVTVSIGLCWAPHGMGHQDDASIAGLLISRADTALYAAKRAGRNCVQALSLAAT